MDVKREQGNSPLLRQFVVCPYQPGFILRKFYILWLFLLDQNSVGLLLCWMSYEKASLITYLYTRFGATFTPKY
jgi:hypothetical protein